MKIIVLLLSFFISSSAYAASSLPNHVYDVTGNFDDIYYFHEPAADKYSEVVFVVYDSTDRKNKYGKIAVVDRQTLAVKKTIEVKEGLYRKIIEKIYSDLEGNLFVVDSKKYVYRSLDSGTSWMQLDFNYKDKVYEFKTITEFDSDKYRRGGYYEAQDIAVTGNGDLLIHSSYDGARATFFPKDAVTAPLGDSFASKLPSKTVNLNNPKSHLSYDGTIIFYYKGTDVAFMSTDKGRSFARMAVPDGHELVDISASGAVLTESRGFYYLDSKALEASDGKRLYGLFHMTKAGLVHDFDFVSPSRYIYYMGADGKVTKTNLGDNYNNYKLYDSIDALVIGK